MNFKTRLMTGIAGGAFMSTQAQDVILGARAMENPFNSRGFSVELQQTKGGRNQENLSLGIGYNTTPLDGSILLGFRQGRYERWKSHKKASAGFGAGILFKPTRNPDESVCAGVNLKYSNKYMNFTTDQSRKFAASATINATTMLLINDGKEGNAALKVGPYAEAVARWKFAENSESFLFIGTNGFAFWNSNGDIEKDFRTCVGLVVGLNGDNKRQKCASYAELVNKFE
jgi:hypothetical protein